jgi:hypothetical protein
MRAVIASGNCWGGEALSKWQGIYWRGLYMDLSEADKDELILITNIVDVARLDEEVKGLLTQFEIADDETLAELKQKIEAIESLRSQYRSELKTYKNHIRK